MYLRAELERAAHEREDGSLHETAPEPGCPLDRYYRVISERYILDASCSNFDPKLGGLQNMLPTLRTAHSITSSAVAAE